MKLNLQNPIMAKIIVVEDDLNLANSYKVKLEEEGHQVKIIGDREAVSTIKQDKPDLVLLDIFMPNVSGISILKELRGDLEFENLSVLVLTNDAKAGDMEQAIALGVDGYILKVETDLGGLAARVKTIMDNKAASQGSPAGGVVQ